MTPAEETLQVETYGLKFVEEEAVGIGEEERREAMAREPDPKTSVEKSKTGAELAEQASKTVQQQNAKRADFASGKKQFTEGK